MTILEQYKKFQAENEVTIDKIRTMLRENYTKMFTMPSFTTRGAVVQPTLSNEVNLSWSCKPTDWGFEIKLIVPESSGFTYDDLDLMMKREGFKQTAHCGLTRYVLDV